MDDSDLVPMAIASDGSSIGDAASGRGQQFGVDEDENEDLYYIPERRPSLDLGSWTGSPMEINNWQYVARASSPALSYTAQVTDDSSVDMSERSPTRIQMYKSDSFSSCYSFDSDDCEKRIRKIRIADTDSEASSAPDLNQATNEIQYPSLTVEFTFKAISDTLKKLSEEAFLMLKMILWKTYLKSFTTPPQEMDLVDVVDRLLECFSMEESVQITTNILETMRQKKIAEYLHTLCKRNEVRHELCETLKRRYREVLEDTAKRPFDDVFTDLYITRICNNGPNIQHEVMTIEKLDSNQGAPICISTQDIFADEKPGHYNTKLMLMTGVAGSGKSMAVRKLVLDWTEGRSHKHISFLFPVPFRELKEFDGSTVSFLDILKKLYPETEKLGIEDFRQEDCKIMFVFDGLDEYDGKLDFENTTLLSDLTEAATLNVIVVNILRGRLLYQGFCLLTSRPQVKPCVPWDTPYEEIEVRGFTDSKKEEYFKRKFKDPAQAAAVIRFISSSKTLCIMCHLPLFCSLVATERSRAGAPKSITYMYTKFMHLLTRQRRRFRAPDFTEDEERDFLVRLGQWAFGMQEQGRFQITKSEWKKTGISDIEAVLNSGWCTQYVIKPHILFQESVVSFIHPTMQEYLAALYTFLSYINEGKNVFEAQHKGRSRKCKRQDVMELYQSAVDWSVHCEDGRLDIFLRFLCGMLRNTNLELLRPLCTSVVKWEAVIENTAALIEKKLRENQGPARNDNLQLCLEELGMC